MNLAHLRDIKLGEQPGLASVSLVIAVPAPSPVSGNYTVTVTGASVMDPTKSARATGSITVNPAPVATTYYLHNRLTQPVTSTTAQLNMPVDTSAPTGNDNPELTGSGKISGPGGTVHTNGSLTACCNGGVSANITFSACTPSSVCTNAVNASCTGTGVPSGCATSNSTVVPVENIPTLTARTFYAKASYVLCAGASNTGEVHLGPAYTGSLGTPADPKIGRAHV